MPKLGRVWVSLPDTQLADKAPETRKSVLLLMQNGADEMRIWAARLL